MSDSASPSAPPGWFRDPEGGWHQIESAPQLPPPSGPTWAQAPAGPAWAKQADGPDWAQAPVGPEWDQPPGPQWDQRPPRPQQYLGTFGPKPKTNLVSAILATCLCFMPLGIVACIYASQVDSKWNAGDRAGAVAASKKARLFANLSLGAAALVWVAMIALLMAAPPTTTRTPRTTPGYSSSPYLDCLADPTTTYEDCRVYNR